MIRLLLADDHPVVRAGLRALFSLEPDFEVVAEAETARDAVAAAIGLEPDVVLMDLQFGSEIRGSEIGSGDLRGGDAQQPDLQGSEATRLIRGEPNAPSVLILTNYDTDADILGAIEAGASGYLLKDAPPAELIAAVRAAAAGESALTPAIETRLVAHVRRPESKLSRRETEVLALVAAGRSNREIGAELFLSEATVKSHLVHIFDKLQVASRTSAVARARTRRHAQGPVRPRPRGTAGVPSNHERSRCGARADTVGRRRVHRTAIHRIPIRRLRTGRRADG